jgi:hypothetical protein
VADQGPVLEARSFQIQQLDQLLLDAIDHRIRGPGRLRQRGGLVDLREVTRIGDRDDLQPPGPGRELRHHQAGEQQQDGRRDVSRAADREPVIRHGEEEIEP